MKKIGDVLVKVYRYQLCKIVHIDLNFIGLAFTEAFLLTKVCFHHVGSI